MVDGTIITFFIYVAVLLAIGMYFYRRSTSIEEYLLGGRGMGAWVTALSAQASDMSGWLLMGLPGAVYFLGIGQIWVAIGLLIGTVLNWLLVASRLRIYTEKTGTITLPSFFEERFKDPTGLLRTLSALLILVFFTIYATSLLIAAGELFEEVFSIRYSAAVLVGGGVVIVYTFLGGFLAVCWTDLFQGLLMVFAVVIVPIIAWIQIGTETITNEIERSQVSMTLIPQQKWPFIAILSSMAWGLGYFGQPHILTRFMSVKSLYKLRESMSIAIIWVVLSLTGAVVIGIVGIGMVPGLESQQEAEKVFIYMIRDLFNPWIAGVMLAAILSAIMSTIDSQLLVSSSALSEDFYQKVVKKQATQKEVVWVGRLCVILISIIAMLLALNHEDTIFNIVKDAWGGFGAAFGPLVLFSLFSRKTTWASALAGLVTSTVVFIVWKQMGLGAVMYEIVPGFTVNCLTIFVIDLFSQQKDPAILQQYDEVVRDLRKT
ncbi:MAG: sodium/proline symporter PutP [Sedimentisphaerales bacterium]|nr:sodium/proline symporter PutP [Sedimentisphaerales bacterium]